MYTSTHAIALFGKLPSHGDFLRFNAGGATVRAMDDWLQRGLYFAKSQAHVDVNGGYEQVPTYRFYYDPGTTGQAMVGTMHFSQDRVGRKYPFVIASESVPDNDAHGWTTVPIRLERFYKSAAALTREAVEGVRDVQAIASQAMGLSSQMGGTRMHLSTYLGQTPVKALWEQIWGFSGDSRKYLLFKNLLDILAPLQGDVPSRFSLVLRFPLGGAQEERTYQAGFWIALTMRLLRTSNLQPSFFWGDGDGETGTFLYFSLRTPPMDTLIHLINEAAETDNVCKLEEMGTLSALEAALAIPASVGQALEDEHLMLSDFLSRI